MSNKHYVGLDITEFENTGEHKPVSRIILHIDEDTFVTAGDDSGKTLEAECPGATQAMVDAMLANLRGYVYKSYNAAEANIDPAFELGDGVTVNGLYSVIAQYSDNGGEYVDLGAPGEPELEEEYPYVGPIEREFNRKMKEAYSLIEKNNEEILLEVGVLGEQYSQLSLTVNGVTSTVSGLNGAVSILSQTVNGLELTTVNGTTYINGSHILTGTVRADVLIGKDVHLLSEYGAEVGTLTITDATTASNAVEWNSVGALRLQAAQGAVYISGTGGSAIIQVRNQAVTFGIDPDYTGAGLNQVVPGGNGNIGLGASNLRWKDIYSANSVIQTSDLDVKTDVEYGLAKYDALFDGLRPMSFRFIDGSSGRRHMGFGAQDVEALMEECGISSTDFATFIKSRRKTEEGEIVEGEYDYALRYSELIPLCIEQIQKLKKRVSELEAR